MAEAIMGRATFGLRLSSPAPPLGPSLPATTYTKAVDVASIISILIESAVALETAASIARHAQYFDSAALFDQQATAAREKAGELMR